MAGPSCLPSRLSCLSRPSCPCRRRRPLHDGDRDLRRILLRV